MIDPSTSLGLPADVSRETLERLDVFQAVLTNWNARLNLVSRGDLGNLWERHVLDSLQLLCLIPPDVERAVDLGSGAGFPAIPIAIASGIAFELIESDHRKASFLREAARETGARVIVHALRAETAILAPAPLVTARALAELRTLIPLAQRFLEPDGICLFPKGARVDAELTAAAEQWHMRAERFPSRTDPTGVILRISEISRVPHSSQQNPGDREPEGRRR